jgi:hypothetical protein
MTRRVKAEREKLWDNKKTDKAVTLGQAAETGGGLST